MYSFLLYTYGGDPYAFLPELAIIGTKRKHNGDSPERRLSSKTQLYQANRCYQASRNYQA
jgi:hypothetical protein